MRFLLLVLFLSGTASFGAAAARCTPAQERQAAQATAQAAARSHLDLLALGYRLRGYRNVGYTVGIRTVSLGAGSATASGQVRVWASEPQRGQVVGGTYNGSVTLKRLAACQWQATGYRQQ